MIQQPDPTAPLLLTVEQAADRLGIGRTLAYALVSAGEIESVQIGRLRRIPADALPAFLDRLRGITADRPAALMAGRAPNGASSIYQGKDGKWHGRVTMGTRDDGRPDRRHVQSSSRAEVTRRVRELEKQRDSGRVQRPGRAWTVEQWLTHWVEHIAAPFVSENTLSSYRVAVRVHLVPGIGAHRLDRLQPEHLERLYVRMMAAGSSAGTAHQVHRTIRTALGEAVRRSYLVTNPAALAKAPRLSETEVEPFSMDDVQRILTAAGERRNGTRWAVALALGLRQGEALGLRWPDVNLDAGTLTVRRSRNRPRYEHGCGGTCGKDRAGYCPTRRQVRADAGDTKSSNGRRAVGLPAELIKLLHAHRSEQDRERQLAAQLWEEGGWVFTSQTGHPVNPSTDYHEWKRLLRAAGVREARLHDARHTAATVLLVLGVPERAVMSLMGWADTGMAKRYQHVTGGVRTEVAAKLDALLWTKSDTNR